MVSFIYGIAFIMQKDIVEKLEFILQELPLRNYYCPDGSACPPDISHGRKSDRLLIVLSGCKNEQMGFNGERRTVQLQAGDFYVIGKGVWERCAFDTAHELFCIVPLAEYLRQVWYPILKPRLPNSLWPEHYALHTRRVPDCLLSTFAVLKSPEAAENPEIARAAAYLAVEIALTEAKSNLPPVNHPCSIFDELQDFVMLNFSRRISRLEIARSFRLSESYVSTLFRKYAGCSFSCYLDRCRLDHAKKLLRETELPIKEIAPMCGYENYVYFVRRFRELTGTPPGRYRGAK